MLIRLFLWFMMSTSLANAQQLGKLFIIGGGKIDQNLLLDLKKEANFKENDYVLILPLASDEPDSSAYFTQMRFENAGMKAIPIFVFQHHEASKEQIDSLLGAKIVYFTGGDQNVLMELVEKLGIYNVLHQARKNGATIAGTSAGAAMMSEVMISGDQHNAMIYRETFEILEDKNVGIGKGMGFLKNVVIDQHFVVRSRYNRIFSVIMEQPNLLGIGIDESTAICVNGNKATVYGNAQVILFQNLKPKEATNGLLKSDQISLRILTAGDVFGL